MINNDSKSTIVKLNEIIKTKNIELGIINESYNEVLQSLQDKITIQQKLNETYTK